MWHASERKPRNFEIREIRTRERSMRRGKKKFQPEDGRILLTQSSIDRMRSQGLPSIEPSFESVHAKTEISNMEPSESMISTCMDQQEKQMEEEVSKIVEEPLEDHVELPIDLQEEIESTVDKASKKAMNSSDPFDDSEDIIRRMKSAYLAALSASDRDEQLKAKKQQREEEKRLMDQLAEESEKQRLIALKQIERMDLERKMREREGGEIIRKQIEEHDRLKAIEAERIEVEKKEAIERVRLELEEAERALERKQAIRNAEVEEMKRTNAAAIAAKHQSQREELEMEKAARRYLEDAQRREEELEKQIQAERLAREEEINKLRKAQMEVSQAVSTREEMLVKRAIEAADIAWEKQQRLETAKKKAMAEELSRARQLYLERKAELEIEAAQQRKETQMKHLQEEEEMKSAIIEDQKKVTAAKEAYRNELKEQLEAKACSQSMESRLRQQEAEAFFDDCEKKKQSLSKIKEDMMEDLSKRGVPIEYTSLLARVKV